MAQNISGRWRRGVQVLDDVCGTLLARVELMLEEWSLADPGGAGKAPSLPRTLPSPPLPPTLPLLPPYSIGRRSQSQMDSHVLSLLF